MEENNQSGMKSAFRNAPLAIGTLLIITLLAACDRNSSDATQPPAVNRISLASLKLNGLKSCDAYKTYVTDALVEQYRPHPGSSLPVESMPGAPQSAPTSAGDAAGASSSAPTHVTGTNNQEPGVDEPDIVKTDTDGNLYIARGNFLRIVAGHPPAELKELAALDAGGTVYDLFLDAKQHRAVLFAAHYDQPVPASPPSAGDVITLPGFYQRVQYVVSFVDVTNPAQPILTTHWTLDGFPLDARRCTYSRSAV